MFMCYVQVGKNDEGSANDVLSTMQLQLEELGKLVKVQGQQLEGQSRLLKVQDQLLDDQGQRLKEQGQRLEEQGKKLEEQGQRLSQQEEDHAALENRVANLENCSKAEPVRQAGLTLFFANYSLKSHEILPKSTIVAYRCRM